MGLTCLMFACGFVAALWVMNQQRHEIYRLRDVCRERADGWARALNTGVTFTQDEKLARGFGVINFADLIPVLESFGWQRLDSHPDGWIGPLPEDDNVVYSTSGAIAMQAFRLTMVDE